MHCVYFDRLHPSLSDQYEDNCKFIDVLSRSENFDDLFISEVHIVPISIEKSIHSRWRKQGYNINDPVIPDVSQLDKSLNNDEIVSKINQLLHFYNCLTDINK